MQLDRLKWPPERDERRFAMGKTIERWQVSAKGAEGINQSQHQRCWEAGTPAEVAEVFGRTSRTAGDL